MARKFCVKTIESIIFYSLVILSCLLGAFLSHNVSFEKEIFFIAYVSVVAYTIIEIIFRASLFFERNKVVLRLIFLVICAAASFVLLKTPSGMIVKQELETPIESFTKIDVKIKPMAGYLVCITFEMSQEQFCDLINKLGFKKIPLEEVKFYGIEAKVFQDKLRNKIDSILSFVQDKRRYDYGPRNIKYFVYDTGTMTAYYEHLNDKGWD